MTSDKQPPEAEQQPHAVRLIPWEQAWPWWRILDRFFATLFMVWFVPWRIGKRSGSGGSFWRPFSFQVATGIVPFVLMVLAMMFWATEQHGFELAFGWIGVAGEWINLLLLLLVMAFHSLIFGGMLTGLFLLLSGKRGWAEKLSLYRSGAYLAGILPVAAVAFVFIYQGEFAIPGEPARALLGAGLAMLILGFTAVAVGLYNGFRTAVGISSRWSAVSAVIGFLAVFPICYLAFSSVAPLLELLQEYS